MCSTDIAIPGTGLKSGAHVHHLMSAKTATTATQAMGMVSKGMGIAFHNRFAQSSKSRRRIAQKQLDSLRQNINAPQLG